MYLDKPNVGMVAHTCDFSTWEIEVGRLEIWGQSRQVQCLERKDLRDDSCIVMLCQTMLNCIFVFL